MYNRKQKLHFIGIGGVGMAGIAEVLVNLGYEVSGSDLKANRLTSYLDELGAQIYIGHHADNLSHDVSVVVVSSAISESNPELQQANALSIPVIPRAEMLAELMRMKYGIAVAGSHGKTTTTSMIAKVLGDLGLDPTVIVGGRVLSQASGARLGRGEYLVAEADESDGSFCLLRPAISVVTNIDREHMSHYGSFDALENAFAEFMHSVPFYGLVVANGDDEIVRSKASEVSRQVQLYGLNPECDLYAANLSFEDNWSSYDLYLCGKEAVRIKLPMPGIHMVENSLAAAAVAIELGGEPREIAESLSEFAGVARRTEKVAFAEGVLVLDDYGHHPTEISATVKAVRQGVLKTQSSKYGGGAGRLIVLFEPHRYSRTKELFNEFTGCFKDVDKLYIGDIYPADEQPIEGVSAENLAKSVLGVETEYIANLEDALQRLVPELRPGDVVLTLGAGSVGNVAHKLGKILEAR